MWRGFSRIAGTVFRISTWIGTQIFKLAKKIFQPIGNFLFKLVKKLVTYVADVLGGALRSAHNALKGLGGGSSAATPGQPQLPGAGRTGGKVATEVAEGGGNMFQRALKGVTNFGKKAFAKGGELLEGGGKAIQSGLGKVQQATTGIEPQGVAKQTKWLDDAIQPLIKAFPAMKGALRGLKGLATGALRAIPGIGFAIDLALNKGVAGQDWTEAIIRALGSSIAGGLSATVGAQVGAGVGGTIGAGFLGVGAIPGATIGAALGAIIAGIAGGYVGDQAGAFAYEGITGETRSENKPENNTSSNLQIQATEGMDQGVLHNPGEKENVKVEVKGTDGMVASATNGNSTPDGMTEPDGSGTTSSFESIDLPPNIVDSGGGDSTGKVEIPAMVDDVPFWQTADPAADAYRNYARQEFELVY